MRTASRALSALAAVAIACLLAATAAAAAETPSVTVRVEGLSETKLAPTQVVLSGSPVVKDGNSEHSCSGTSALGALEIATAGNWSGPWNSTFNQYEIFTIEGELHQFEKGAPANYFWSFWLDDKEAEVGACEAQVKAGDRVLFFPSCFGEACPSPTPLPLEIEAPATASVGEPVSMTVTRYTSAGVGSNVSGASVVGGGAGAITDSSGRATLAFSHPGETLVAANAPNSIRTEATICVHNGNDGTCGTAAAPTGPVQTPAPTPPAADIAAVQGIRNGHVYSRRGAPRLLAGIVTVPNGATLRQVRISLQRRVGRRCFAFNGARGQFVRARCGKPSFFSVGGSVSFSYLLPARLAAGRYVYDIEAVEGSGNTTKLVAGTSHVVFRVR